MSAQSKEAVTCYAFRGNHGFIAQSLDFDVRVSSSRDLPTTQRELADQIMDRAVDRLEVDQPISLKPVTRAERFVEGLHAGIKTLAWAVLGSRLSERLGINTEHAVWRQDVIEFPRPGDSSIPLEEMQRQLGL